MNNINLKGVKHLCKLHWDCVFYVWPLTPENTEGQHHQMICHPKSSLNVKTSPWTSKSLILCLFTFSPVLVRLQCFRCSRLLRSEISHKSDLNIYKATFNEWSSNSSMSFAFAILSKLWLSLLILHNFSSTKLSIVMLGALWTASSFSSDLFVAWPLQGGFQWLTTIDSATDCMMV